MERWTMYIFKLFLASLVLPAAQCGQEQQILDTIYVVAGESTTLTCTSPDLNNLLMWKFVANGSKIEVDVAQVYPGAVTTIFNQFNEPLARTKFADGLLTITQVGVQDEGEYWCEISLPATPTVLNDKYPVHVWVPPQPPKIIGLGNGTILEYAKISVARCSSSGGKPESKLSWWNGTRLLTTTAQPVVSKNVFGDRLWDISLDLVLERPTRFDHRRNFTCLVEHPAYKGKSRSLNHSVNVLYHPIKARIWANVTSLFVHCEAEGYKAPKFDWVIPGDLKFYDVPSLHIGNLYELPGYEFFECRAYNYAPPDAVVRIMVDDLRWPDGKPVIIIAGLAWYVWAGIGAGVLVLIIIVIISLCCYCRKKKKGVGYNTDRTEVAYHRPASTGIHHSRTSLLDFESMRTPDGRESSLPPSEYNHSKASMARSYSLEQLADGRYPPKYRDSVELLPANQSRDNMYNDASLRRRASCEEIDKVVDHIEVLNKSWDNLARSREDLSRSREELRHQDPSQSRADNYPYMDDTSNARDDRYNTGYSDYHGNQQCSDGYGAPSGEYDQLGYQGNQLQQYHHDNQHRYDDRNASYGDSEFDDDVGNYDNRNYDTRGFQPASMI